MGLALIKISRKRRSTTCSIAVWSGTASIDVKTQRSFAISFTEMEYLACASDKRRMKMNLTQEVLRRSRRGQLYKRVLTLKVDGSEYDAFNDTCSNLGIKMTTAIRELMAVFIEQNNKKIGRPLGSINKEKVTSMI